MLTRLEADWISSLHVIWVNGFKRLMFVTWFGERGVFDADGEDLTSIHKCQKWISYIFFDMHTLQ